MSLIGAKRLQQAAFEMAASSNRFQGSGGGSGLAGTILRQLAVSGSVGNQNFTSTSAADITGTSISFPVGVGITPVLLQGFVTGKVTVGANNGQVIIKITGPGGYSNSNGALYFGVTNFITLFSYLRLQLSVPGTYTASLQAFVDVAGTTFNVPGNSTVLEAIQVGG